MSHTEAKRLPRNFISDLLEVVLEFSHLLLGVLHLAATAAMETQLPWPGTPFPSARGTVQSQLGQEASLTFACRSRTSQPSASRPAVAVGCPATDLLSLCGLSVGRMA